MHFDVLDSNYRVNIKQTISIAYRALWLSSFSREGVFISTIRYTEDCMCVFPPAIYLEGYPDYIGKYPNIVRFIYMWAFARLLDDYTRYGCRLLN